MMEEEIDNIRQCILRLQENLGHAFSSIDKINSMLNKRKKSSEKGEKEIAQKNPKRRKTRNHRYPSLVNMLSDKLLDLIISFLDAKSLCELSLVCSHMKNIADNSLAWFRIFDEKLGFSWVFGENLSEKRKYYVIHSRVTTKKWETGGQQTTLIGHRKPIKQLRFIENLLMTCDENVVKEWDLKSKSLKEAFAVSDQKYLSLEFNLDKLLISTNDTISAYELRSKKMLYSLKNILSPIVCFRFNPFRIWTGAWNGSISVRRTNDGEKILDISGHNNPIYCLDVFDDTIVSGSSDKWLKLWNSQTGDLLHVFKGHSKTIQTVQIVSNFIISGSKDGTIRMWDARSSIPIGKNYSTSQIAHNGGVSCLQFDEMKIVSGGFDNLIKVWDIRTCKFMYKFTEHETPITNLQFNRSMIVSGSEDGFVKVWEFEKF
ncbi:MAG: F-box-like domain-containing protein [Candidatus Woesearchaeota archaeon]|jgi:WD40 repeat protein